MKNKLAATDETFTLNAGDYWIGDPCYVFPSERWLDFCALCDSNFLEDFGIKFFVCGTAYGDGFYSLKKKGIEVGGCGVDSGMLAIIPVALLKRWKSKKGYTGKQDNFGGVFVTLEKDSEIEFNGNGNFEFGDFKMVTDDSDSDDDETEYNY